MQPTCLATGGDEDCEGIEPISEQCGKVRTRLMDRIHIGAGNQDFDRLDVVTALPLLPHAVPSAETRQEVCWWGGWSSEEATRSTVVYHDGSGYDAAWPELRRRGWACVQTSTDNAPLGATFGAPPGRR